MHHHLDHIFLLYQRRFQSLVHKVLPLFPRSFLLMERYDFHLVLLQSIFFLLGHHLNRLLHKLNLYLFFQTIHIIFHIHSALHLSAFFYKCCFLCITHFRKCLHYCINLVCTFLRITSANSISGSSIKILKAHWYALGFFITDKNKAKSLKLNS